MLIICDMYMSLTAAELPNPAVIMITWCQTCHLCTCFANDTMHHKPVSNEHVGEAQAFDEDQQQRAQVSGMKCRF